MRSIPFVRAQFDRFSKRAGRVARRRAWSPPLGATECLEPRWMLSTASAAVPAIQMISATTTDSKSVTIEYNVSQTPNPAAPITFGIYRSSDGKFDSSDVLAGTATLGPPGTSSATTLDQAGQPATGLGNHQLTIPLPEGLAPFPEKPYVLVVADPSLSTATANPAQAASFRTYTIGIVTHGGIQDTSWKNGPPWELQIAYEMKHEGYAAVIPYNWVSQSGNPGEAIKQSPKLARIILHTASKFPASAPVDLDFIGHSEGTVINTYAIVRLKDMMTPGLQAGYINDTMLDPHAANNGIPGQQLSIAGGVLRLWPGQSSRIIRQVPRTQPSSCHPSSIRRKSSSSTMPARGNDLYNLWGQVPVKSNGPVVHYYNLTPTKATHTGKTGIQFWYRNFIVPSLGDQAPLVRELQLNGQIDNAQVVSLPSTVAQSSVNEAVTARDDRVYGPAQVVQTNQPEFSGTAAPGSLVKLSLSPMTKPSDHTTAGTTHADNTGHWSMTTSYPLHDGQYRVVVSAFSRALFTRPAMAVVPMQPLGRLVVNTS